MSGECPICYTVCSALRPDEVRSGPCGHSFCAECLYRWTESDARNANLCPVCRTALAPEQADSNSDSDIDASDYHPGALLGRLGGQYMGVVAAANWAAWRAEDAAARARENDRPRQNAMPIGYQPGQDAARRAAARRAAGRRPGHHSTMPQSERYMHAAQDEPLPEQIIVDGPFPFSAGGNYTVHYRVRENGVDFSGTVVGGNKGGPIGVTRNSGLHPVHGNTLEGQKPEAQPIETNEALPSRVGGHTPYHEGYDPYQGRIDPYQRGNDPYQIACDPYHGGNDSFQGSYGQNLTVPVEEHTDMLEATYGAPGYGGRTGRIGSPQIPRQLNVPRREIGYGFHGAVQSRSHDRAVRYANDTLHQAFAEAEVTLEQAFDDAEAALQDAVGHLPYMRSPRRRGAIHRQNPEKATSSPRARNRHVGPDTSSRTARIPLPPTSPLRVGNRHVAREAAHMTAHYDVESTRADEIDSVLRAGLRAHNRRSGTQTNATRHSKGWGLRIKRAAGRFFDGN